MIPVFQNNTMMMQKASTSLRHSNKSNNTSSTASSSRSSTSQSYYNGAGNGTSSTGGYDSRRLWAGRIAFLLTLVAVAITFGFLSYRLLTESENQLTEEQFQSIADRATCSAMQATERKRLGTQSLASVIGGANPNAADWPNAVLNNYETISYNIIHTSKGCNMGFVPFVYPDQVDDFEDFIYDFYQHSRMPEPWPNGTAIQKTTSSEDWPDGKGIWSKDSEGNVFHDNTGATSWNSSYAYLAPMIHHNSGASKKLLYNMHSIPGRGKLMDEMMECAREKAATPGGSLDECVVVTPIIANKTSRVQKVENGPGASMMQPIYPSNDPTKLVGVVMTGIVWAEIMESTYSDSVNGVDVVLSDGESRFTYKIVDGQAYLEGEGDLHDPKFDSYGHMVDMTTPQFFGNTSSHYTLTLYPTQELYDVYSTPNPMIAAIGSVCVIALTSVLFLLYDFSVRREFHARKELLEAKRRFCRFVSHEVRTPLNSVCMGLTLMTEEMESSLAQAAQHNKTTEETKPLFQLTTTDASSAADKQSAEDVRSWLNLTEEITANAYSAVNVLNEFLNYDKIQSNKLQLEYSVVPIFDLLQQTVGEFQIPASKKKINLQVLIPPPSQEQYLVGDKVRLTMVVRNLISNSLKFTPEEGTITVRASWIPPTEKELRKKLKNKAASAMEFVLENQETVVCFPNGSFHLTVSDTGIGMTPEQIKTVFKQGSQFNVNQLQAGKGSGLGTWIAKGIIQQHGGLMSASSDGLHRGSTFTVNLPIHDIPSVDGGKSSSNSKNSSTVEPTVRSIADNSLDEDGRAVAAVGDQAVQQDTPAQDEEQVAEEEEEDPIGCLNILVVDDAKMNLKLLSRLLLKHGHTVTGAEDGDIAVEKVKETMPSSEDDPESAASKKKKFDLILMDYQMPRMTGPEAAKKIREMGSDAFLIGVTGNVMPEDIRVFKEHGANAVLPKPIKIPDLENLLVEYGIRGEEPDDEGDNVNA